jgi:hypothetical protein
MTTETTDRTEIETLNRTLGGFVSLASDPTAMPAMQGLDSPRAPLASTLAVAAASIVALWVRA